MRVRNYLEYAAVAALLGLCRMLPRCMVYGLFRGLGLLGYALLSGRRKITRCNLRIVFPDMDEQARRQLAKKAYLNLAESLALNNLIISGRISDKELLELVDPESWEAFIPRVAACKTGPLVISGHLGNWELLSLYAGLRLPDRQVHVIARKTDNQVLERKIIMPLRKRFGMKIYYKKNALMHIVKASKKGDISALMLDQKLYPPDGFFMDFFGRSAPTGGSPALLQIRFGIPVLPAFLVKTGPHRHKVVAPDPVPWKDNGKPLEEQVQELTRLHQAIMEEMIRKYPDQWFWMHNRWGVPKAEQ